MKAALQLPVSPEDYLAGELRASVKHEYVDGRMYAMAGTSIAHGRTVTRLAGALMARARGSGCEGFIADLKVHVPATNSYYYPDVVLNCEPLHDTAYVIANACLIAEVSSPTTEAIDRREKLRAYQTLTSLREYLIVDPSEPKIEVWRRTSEGWLQELLDQQDTLNVECLSASIPLSEIYAA